MSKRGIVFLAIGMVVLGLVLGIIGGVAATRFAVRRNAVRSFAAGRMAPRFFGAPRMMPFSQPGMRAAPRNFNQRGGQVAPRNFGRRGMPAAPRNSGPGRIPFGNGNGNQNGQSGSQFITNGASVTMIDSSGPAGKAGLQNGDLITAIGGTKIDNTHSITSLLQAHKPGEKVDLSVTRGGQNITINVELGASPQNSSTAYLGIQFRPSIQRPSRTQ
jgi:S1-C subfamily serine protease